MGWRLAGVAALGATLVEVVLIMTEGIGHAFTVDRIPIHLTAVTVGGLLGWMYELLRELSAATTESLRRISTMVGKIEYQDDALSMLTACPRHNEVLTRLIKASMKENFRNVPYVGEAAYLEYLGDAIEHSGGFQGVQRKPLRWFRDNRANPYLHALRDRRMDYKTRIFIIDDADVPAMEEDLGDQELLAYYWENGGEIDSYWISTERFRQQFPGQRIPDDFALFDGRLLIAYDFEHQVLTFNLLKESSRERQIFDGLRTTGRVGLQVFAKIPRDLQAA
jgi:hypothetical protein